MLLKSKLYISLILAIVLPLTISILLFSYSLRTHTEEKLRDIDLPTSLNEVKNAIELELTTPVIIAKEVAQNTFVKAWLNNNENINERQDFIDYLVAIKNDNKNTLRAFIASKSSGNYYSGDGDVRKMNQQADPWFTEFLASNKNYVLSVDIDEITKQPTLFINYVIINRGERVGVAGIGLTLNAMVQLVKNYRIGESGIVYLVTDSGKIMLHGEQTKIGQSIDLESIKNGKMIEREMNNENHIISSSQLTGIYWHLVAEIPSKQLYGPLNDAINKNVMVGVVIAFVGFIFVRILASQIFQPIEQITDAVGALTEKDGDLTVRLPVNNNNEISELATKFNLFLAQLHEMFKQVSISATQVKNISERVEEQVQDATHLTEVQSSSTQTVAAAVTEMEMTVQDISNSANDASQIALSTESTTLEASSFVNNTIIQMQKLEESMASSVNSVVELSAEIKSISHVLDVIKGISEQTNLLALNTAIEAARAGEQGRGFAVVADEVRTLAKRTAESTEQINEMIETLNSKASTTVGAIELGSKGTLENAERLKKTGLSLDDIAREIVSLTEINATVATATQEQTIATSEISQNIVMISDSSAQTKENMIKSQSLCNGLNKESNTLQELIGRFTI